MDTQVEEAGRTREDRTVEAELRSMAVSSLGEAQHRVPSDQPSDIPRETEHVQTFSVTSPVRETDGGQAVEIELDTLSVSRGDDSPPEYTTVLTEEALDSEAAVATATPTTQPENSLTVEAPPSYRQLFGVEEGACRQTYIPPHHRRYILERQRQINRQREMGCFGCDDDAKAVKTTLFVVVLVVGVCLSLSMICAGSIGIHNHTAKNIPLYLLVAGFIILFDLCYHTLITIYYKYTDDPTPELCHWMRRCDICVLFLFIWLLMGTYWIFTEEASSWLFTFAAVLIVCQYMVAVGLLCICCIYLNNKR